MSAPLTCPSLPSRSPPSPRKASAGALALAPFLIPTWIRHPQTGERVPTPEAVRRLVAAFLGDLAEQDQMVYLTAYHIDQRALARLAPLRGDALTEARERSGLPGQHGGVVVISRSHLTNEEAQTLAEHLAPRGLDFTRIADRLIFGNFTKYSDAELSDAEFLAQITDAIRTLPWETKAERALYTKLTHASPFYLRFDGDLIGEHLGRNPTQWEEIVEQSVRDLAAVGFDFEGALRPADRGGGARPAARRGGRGQAAAAGPEAAGAPGDAGLPESADRPAGTGAGALLRGIVFGFVRARPRSTPPTPGDSGNVTPSTPPEQGP